MVLVADKNMSQALRGILETPARLGVRQIDILGIHVHPKRDPAVYRQAHDFLRSFQRQSDYALVLFDRDGCGSTRSREELELDIETRLAQNGWGRRCAAICIEPELESWVWSKSPHVASALGWERQELQSWLDEGGHWPKPARKPAKPKEVVEAALRAKNIPRSSSIYYEIATKVSFDGCSDPAFQKLRQTLSSWFSPEDN